MNDKTIESVWIHINQAADLFRFDAFCEIGGNLESYTVSQQNVLGVVYTHPDRGLMVKEIAARVGVTCGAVSQTVESLVKLGLLERSPSKEDRRAVFVRATPTGNAIREKLIMKIAPALSEVLSDVTASERSSFLGILERMADRLTADSLFSQK